MCRLLPGGMQLHLTPHWRGEHAKQPYTHRCGACTMERIRKGGRGLDKAAEPMNMHAEAGVCRTYPGHVLHVVI